VLGEADDGVRISDPSGKSHYIGVGNVQHQHLGAATVDSIQMTLPRPVQEGIARLHPISARIAGFNIATGEYDRCKGMIMQMAWEILAGRMAEPTHVGAAQIRPSA
jgi:hypothetical protein